jgi:methyl-accepting chemotaxis protein
MDRHPCLSPFLPVDEPHEPAPSLRFTSVATRLMLGVAAIASLCFDVTAAIIYVRSSDALLTSTKTGMADAAHLEAQRVSSDIGAAFVSNQVFANRRCVVFR